MKGHLGHQRSNGSLEFVPQIQTTRLGRRSFFIAAPVVWNSPPIHLRSQFQAGLKTHLFRLAFHWLRTTEEIELNWSKTYKKTPTSRWLLYQTVASTFWILLHQTHNAIRYVKAAIKFSWTKQGNHGRHDKSNYGCTVQIITLSMTSLALQTSSEQFHNGTSAQLG